MADGDDDDEFAVNIREAGPSMAAPDLDRCTQCFFLARSAPWRPCSLCGRASGAWQRRRRQQPSLRARPRAAPPRPPAAPPAPAASAAELDLDAAIDEIPPAAAAAAESDDDEFAVNVRRPAAASLDDKIAALEAELKEMDEDEDAGPMPPTPSGSDSDGGGGSDDEPAAAAAPPGAKRARPPPPDEADLYCAVCDVRVTSVALMREHRRGKKHLEAAKESEARAEGRYCEVCALAFTGVVQFAEHVKGRKHKERAASRGA